MGDLFGELSLFLQRVDLLTVVDLLLVTGILAIVLRLVQGTRAVVLLRGTLLLVVVISVLAGLLDLPAFSWLLRTALPALLVAIPVIFAPEIRRGLERIGRAGRFFAPNTEAADIRRRISAITSAAQRLSDRRYGAMIVVEREIRLDEYIETGVDLDARLSQDLLLQIFFINTPLHDGAAVVRGDRVAAAACVMPLSSSGTLSRGGGRQMGLRHRAALGISEVSDAVAVVVSEETGTISVAHSGRMIRRLDQSRLRNILFAFYRPLLPRRLPMWLERIIRRLSRRSVEASVD